MQSRFRMLRLPLVLSLAAGAARLLYAELRHYSPREILDGLGAVSPWQVAAALMLTIVNYALLVGYDWLAVRSIPHPLPLRRIALASFCGHAVSYNFGALLGGGAVRCRLYRAWGLTAIEIVRLLAMLGVTFWMGAFALAGVLLVIAPPPIPPGLHLPIANARPAGVLFLGLTLAYLSFCTARRGPLVIRGRAFVLPTLRVSVMQILVSSVDLIVAASVLYSVLPDSVPVGFVHFTGVYLLGVVAVLLTHVPGGVGVFELVVLSLLTTPHSREHVLAALLVFRVIYLLLPLLAAALLLTAHEIHLSLRRDTFRAMTSDAVSPDSRTAGVLSSLEPVSPEFSGRRPPP